MPTEDLNRILNDCATAKALINRIERRIHCLAAPNTPRIAKSAPKTPQDAFEREKQTSYRPEPENASERELDGISAKSLELNQAELFSTGFAIGSNDALNPKKKSGNQKNLTRKGCPTLSRRQCLDNLRRISAVKNVLDLADVNEIFGYSRTTSGTFVRHAWKRGDIVGIPCGRGFAFMPPDVRAFIKIHFDRTDGQRT